VTNLKLMEGRYFGLTMKELRNLVFQLAVINGKYHPFKKEKGEAGMDLLHGFMNRHHDLSLRKPEPTSTACTVGFQEGCHNREF